MEIFDVVQKKRQKSSKRITPEQQHARFVEAAKKAEADEALDAMDKAFGKIEPRKRSVPKK